jgi:flagellar secretion chaperone FliS
MFCGWQKICDSKEMPNPADKYLGMYTRTTAFQSYQDQEVLAAEPLELIRLAYRGALDAIRAARQAVRAGDIGRRNRSITKAQAILNELALALDHEKGGALSRNLAELYDYCQRLLIQANFEQSEPPLAQAEQILGTLLGAWQQCTPEPQQSALVGGYRLSGHSDAAYI